MERTVRKKKWADQQKQHIVKQWLMSLVVTTVVVVAVVIMPQRTPLASFDRVGTFERMIYYSVTVQDPDSTIESGSLKLMVESQFETLEYPLQLGMNTDTLSNLMENTRYHLKVVASRGFGVEVLAVESIDTNVLTGGAITDVSLLTTDLSNYELVYEVETKIANPSDLYTELYYKVATVYPNSGIDITDLSQLTFESTLLTSNTMVHTLMVSNYNPTMIAMIEGITAEGETVILDQYQWQAPLRFEGSVYATDITYDSITASVYLSDPGIEGIRYELQIFEEIKKIQTMEVFPTDFHTMYEEPELIVSGLKANTEYHLELWAFYEDPITSKTLEILIQRSFATTAPAYTLTVDWTDQGSYYQIEINLNDPNQVFEFISVMIYDTSQEWDLLLSSEALAPSSVEGDQIIYAFEVIKPDIEPYEIRIVATKIWPDGTYYYDTTIVTITQED